MPARETITSVLLWLAVLIWGCMLGGIIYETLVVVPAWTAEIPQSMSVMTHPLYPVVPARMWIPFSNLHTIFSLAVLIAAWKQPTRRRWLMLAMAIVLLSHIMQFGYFWPTNRAMAASASSVEAASMAKQWTTVNWFRVVYIAVGFVATLRAFGGTSAGLRREL